ncbi:heterokaryon incompatibility protein-domain-containing protein [Trametes gibbosa]|nr:heterokaryon incompatibility protein-domain-containing protein [Trametes gibbosa]
MWLLNTTNATLHFFADAKAPPYVILSHVWGPDEQSFGEVMAINLRPPQFDHPSLPRLSAKIRGFCAYALRRGYKWAWIDTCCIDKSSSAELSEALNSMYSWYAAADMCFAFLQDIRGDEDPRAPSSSFRFSAWFTRGWTLQELLAPNSVIFLSPQWQIVGTNRALANVIEEITGIDNAVLTHERPLSDVSVARRMSWASGRRTTRVEDRAYSLMGIFGVYMPTVYGEGMRSFTRLQEEILKHIPDQSIFAWGHHPGETDHAGGLQNMPRRPLAPTVYRTRLAYDSHRGLQGLLAHSPEDFSQSADIRPIPFGKLSEMLRMPVPIPVYHPTSGGLRIQMPVLTQALMPPSESPGSLPVSSAVLACITQTGKLVTLYLRRESSSADVYLIGCPTEHRYLRTALWQDHNPPDVRMVDLYVMHERPLSAMAPAYPMQQPRTSTNITTPLSIFFLFPVWVLARLQLTGFYPVQRTTVSVLSTNFQVLRYDDGVSIDVRRESIMSSNRLMGTQVFARFVPGTNGATMVSSTFSVTFWEGCGCAIQGDIEGVWVDVSVTMDGNSARSTPAAPASSLPSESGAHGCPRAHLTHGVSDMRFERGPYIVHCRVMPCCEYPLQQDGFASCEFLVELDVHDRLPQHGFTPRTLAPSHSAVPLPPSQPPPQSPTASQPSLPMPFYSIPFGSMPHLTQALPPVRIVPLPEESNQFVVPHPLHDVDPADEVDETSTSPSPSPSPLPASRSQSPMRIDRRLASHPHALPSLEGGVAVDSPQAMFTGSQPVYTTPRLPGPCSPPMVERDARQFSGYVQVGRYPTDPTETPFAEPSGAKATPSAPKQALIDTRSERRPFPVRFAEPPSVEEMEEGEEENEAGRVEEPELVEEGRERDQEEEQEGPAIWPRELQDSVKDLPRIHPHASQAYALALQCFAMIKQELFTRRALIVLAIWYFYSRYRC